MTGSLETSAITWGDTHLTIRRSARRKKTVAVTVDPGGEVLLLAPEDFPTSRLDEVAGGRRRGSCGGFGGWGRTECRRRRGSS